MKKPLLLTRVTTPLVMTSWPAIVLVAPLPWMAGMVAAMGMPPPPPPPPPLQISAAAVLLRGAGAPTLKSLMLLPVSSQPPPLRSAAVVLLSTGVGVPSMPLAVP